MIEQAKCAYSPLGKAFEKQTKTIEEQKIEGKKQIKAIENHGKQLAESNELIKQDFNIDGEYTTWWTKKYWIDLTKKDLMNFQNLKEKNNPNTWYINKYKTEGKIPKDISDYRNLIDLRTNWLSIKSRRNKKGNPKSKSKDQICVIQNL